MMSLFEQEEDVDIAEVETTDTDAETTEEAPSPGVQAMAELIAAAFAFMPTDDEASDKIKKIMEKDSNVICIAMSSIFSTGVNIKNLHNIIFAAGGKSFIRTVQSVGRGLRKHASKNKLIIFDICDKLRYGIRHSEKRKDIYEKEKIKYTQSIILEK